MDLSFKGIKDGVVSGTKKTGDFLIKKPFNKTKDFTKSQTNKMASEPDQPNVYDVIVIGGGLSGLSATLNATQQKLKTLFISGEHQGGKLNSIIQTSNWPGYRKTSGADLASVFQDHVKKLSQDSSNFDLWIREEKATSVKQNDKKEFVVVSDKKDTTYTAKSVICATGSTANKLDVDGEEKGKEFQHGLVTESTFSPELYEEKKIIIIGNGEHAMNTAFRAEKYVSNVTIITKDDELWGNDDLAKKIKDANHIDVKTKTKIKEILLEKDSVKGVKIEEDGGNASNFDGDLVIEILGNKANTDYLKDLKLDQEDNGAIKVNEDRKSSIDGLFAVGDCNNISNVGLSTTSGEGEIAASKAFEYVVKL